MDVQQLFSSREDEAQDYNLGFFSYPPGSRCAAGGGITTPALTEPLQVSLSTDEGNGQVWVS